jgi:hypothetical protein
LLEDSILATMIVIKLVSGLGNQLFQYAVGRRLSLMHNAELKIDTSFFINQKLRSYKLSHYNIVADTISSDEVATFLACYTSPSLAAKIYRRVEALLPKRYKRHFREDEWWVREPDVFRIRPSVYLEGYWQHHSYFEGLPPQITEELTLREPYPFEARALLKSVEEDNSSVALHIRRGDYITDVNAQELMGVLPLSYYMKAITYIKSKVQNPTFYIFSDDLRWAAEHLLPEAPMVLVDIAGGKLDYVELDLMSKCRHAVIANSSFSWWGAYLNRNPDKVVVAPAQWVVPVAINQRIKLQFPTWTTI